MEQAIETIEQEKVTIKIFPDFDPENPREWDNAGKLLIFGGRNCIDVNELGMTLKTEDFNGWEDMENAVMEAFPGCELLPVYRYEHSNVAYNTTGFSCPWDSGRVGLIICTRETMIAEWGKKLATKAVREKARKYLAGEVETYSQWANGEVYGYDVQDKEGNSLDSCWGFYGIDYCREEALSQAEYSAKTLTEAGKAELAGQLTLEVA